MVFEIMALAVVFIIASIVILLLFKQILVNTVLGLLALFAVNYVGKEYGIHIAVNLFTLLITAILGIAGVGLLIILDAMGVKIV
mgnify:FL=1